MAPLAATVAAGVAVGVGIVVLARASREREEAERRKRERELGLRPDEAPADGLKRMALAQAGLAIELLEEGASDPIPRGRAIHDTRKALKRLRALLRLLKGELGAGTFAREDAALRDIARRLSGARDSEVMLATLDALIERHPRKLGRGKSVRKLRRWLLAEHRRMERQTLGDSATRTQALAELRNFRARVMAWQLPNGNATKSIDAGLLKLYTQGRARHGRATRGKGRDTLAMHRWRKRVKDLRYASEMLERRSCSGADIERRSRSRAGKGGRDARLRRLASRADGLAEALGEDHDLAVLAELVRGSAKPRGQRRKRHRNGAPRITRKERKTLLKLIERRRRELRRQALRDGRRLYRRGPKRFVRRLS